jgi:3-oxoacyl-[acyl-carrier protein] reductase
MQATLDKNSGPHSYCDRNSHGQSVDLWLSAKELVPGVIDCLFDNMALRYNSTNKTYSNTPGVTLDGSVDFGGVDGVINNAGILRDGLLIKVKDGEISKRMSLAEWQAVIDVNLTGVFLCGREAATRMIEGKRAGVIINISSISKAGNMGQSNYSAAKAGVASMAVVWAKELSSYGIRSAAIAPGFIETEMVASMKPEALEKMAAGIPLKRLGQPEEIGRTAVYIFENDYLTGRVLEVDGGIRI